MGTEHSTDRCDIALAFHIHQVTSSGLYILTKQQPDQGHE